MLAALDVTKAKADVFNWSSVTFAMWDAITSFTGSDIKSLRYIGSCDIDNASTQSIIRRALDGTSEQTKTFTADSKAFFALLGSPNGYGGVYLLMEHKRQLGHKTITQAVVFKEGNFEEPTLVFVVEDVPPLRSGRMTTTNATSVDEEKSFCLSSDGLSNGTLITSQKDFATS